jgi:hypothetical protein
MKREETVHTSLSERVLSHIDSSGLHITALAKKSQRIDLSIAETYQLFKFLYDNIDLVMNEYQAQQQTTP